MGFIDGIAKGMLDKISGGVAQNPLFETVLGLISNPEIGGLQGMLETFKSKGLGEIISSWIGTGENQAISKDQILEAIGKDQIQKMAEKVGISQEEASGGLASLLPEIIDKLTPNGELPEGGLSDLVNKIMKS
ncbi:MAG: YidB family protein [Thermodesulfobacteriota bacterium]